MRSMDDPTIIEDLYRLGCIAARQQVKKEHWIGEMATWCNGQKPSALPREMPTRITNSSPLWMVYKQISTATSYVRSAAVRIRGALSS